MQPRSARAIGWARSWSTRSRRRLTFGSDHAAWTKYITIASRWQRMRPLLETPTTEDISNGFAQCRLNGPGRVTKFTLCFFGRQCRSPQCNPDPLGRGGWRMARHIVGDELQHCRGHFRNSARNRDVEIAAAADQRHQSKNFVQRDAFAAQEVAMPDLSV